MIFLDLMVDIGPVKVKIKYYINSKSKVLEVPKGQAESKIKLNETKFNFSPGNELLEVSN